MSVQQQEELPPLQPFQQGVQLSLLQGQGLFLQQGLVLGQGAGPGHVQQQAQHRLVLRLKALGFRIDGGVLAQGQLPLSGKVVLQKGL